MISKLGRLIHLDFQILKKKFELDTQKAWRGQTK